MKSESRQSVLTAMSRPGVPGLVKRILRGAVADGMQLPVILGAGLVLAMYYAQLPYHGIISGILLTALLLTGLVRGVIGWQQDRAAYHRELVILRHQHRHTGADYTIPGYIPFSHHR